MDSATYTRNALKTLSQGPAKLGMKFVARNKVHLNVFHTITGIHSELGELVTALGSYIVGAAKLSEPMKMHAAEECGDVLYYVATAARTLKVKMPSSTKKLRFKGITRSQALIDGPDSLLGLSSRMADLVKKNFYGPVMVEKEVEREKKVFDLDGEGKVLETFTMKKETVKAMVEDKDATEAKWQEREHAIAAMLSQFIELFWAFCFETFEFTPNVLMDGNIAKLQKRYPQGFFDLGDSEDRDTDDEQAQVTAKAQEAAAAPKPAAKKGGFQKKNVAAPATAPAAA